MNIRAGKIGAGALLALSLVFSIAVGVPQGKGPKNGGTSRGNSGKADNAGNRRPDNDTRQTPGPPSNKGGGSNNVRLHQSCVQGCNAFHKQEQQACKGRTGPGRGACERAINERHRVCVTSCPK
jgi:hypothetical protein